MLCITCITLIVIQVRIQRGGEGGRGVRTPPPLKNHKNIGFSSNTGPDLLKDCSYQASIQCLAIMGTAAKRHLMAFRSQANDGPLIVVLGSSLPSSNKKNEKKAKKKTLSKFDPLWQNFLDPHMWLDQKRMRKWILKDTTLLTPVYIAIVCNAFRSHRMPVVRADLYLGIFKTGMCLLTVPFF